MVVVSIPAKMTFFKKSRDLYSISSHYSDKDNDCKFSFKVHPKLDGEILQTPDLFCPYPGAQKCLCVLNMITLKTVLTCLNFIIGYDKQQSLKPQTRSISKYLSKSKGKRKQFKRYGDQIRQIISKRRGSRKGISRRGATKQRIKI